MKTNNMHCTTPYKFAASTYKMRAKQNRTASKIRNTTFYHQHPLSYNTTTHMNSKAIKELSFIFGMQEWVELHLLYMIQRFL